MAFVDDDVAEVVLGIVLDAIHAEGLIGGDVDAGIPGVVAAVAVALDRGGVGAEDVLKGTEGLGAQLVVVAEKQGTPELPGVGNALE